MSLVGAELIHNHDLPRPHARSEHFFDVVSLEHFAEKVAPSTARGEGPIPSTQHMLASKVVFFPRLGGTEQYARAVLYVIKHAGHKGKCSPPSRPRKPAAGAPPSRRASSSRPLSTTRLVPPPPQESVFSTEAKRRFNSRPMVEVLKDLLVGLPKKRQLSGGAWRPDAPLRLLRVASW
jgi:hypothetical protein